MRNQVRAGRDKADAALGRGTQAAKRFDGIAGRRDAEQRGALAARRRTDDHEIALRDRLPVMHQPLRFESRLGLRRIREADIELAPLERLEQRLRGSGHQLNSDAGVAHERLPQGVPETRIDQGRVDADAQRIGRRAPRLGCQRRRMQPRGARTER